MVLIELNPKTKKPYKWSRQAREKRKGSGNPCFGKHFKCSEEKKNKISFSNKGKKSFLGKKHSIETKEKMREMKIGKPGKPCSEEIKEKLRISNVGQVRTKEAREKMSKSAKERVKNSFNLVVNYNKKACEWFSKFDKDNNTNGLYATNGGEKKIKKTGYFVDYFNSDLKLIMEWDEKKHYCNGKLKEKDVKRQNEIQKIYSNYKFIRIRENELIRS